MAGECTASLQIEPLPNALEVHPSPRRPSHQDHPSGYRDHKS